MRKLFVIYLMLFATSLFSQTKLFFKDSITQKPAVFVMVINEEGKVIGTSNELGEIYLENINKSINKIFIKSIFYEKKGILINKLKDNKIILLKPLMNSLDEVFIDSKKYLALMAYCRVYNLIDDDLKSFVDAEVKYIIRDNSIQKRVLNYRIFDTIPTSQYSLKNKNPYWIPDIRKLSLFEKLNSKFNLIEDEEENSIKIVGREDNALYGVIEVKSDIKNNSNIEIETFKNSKYFDRIKKETYYNDELLKVTIKDLKYQSKESVRIIDDAYVKADSLLRGKEKLFFCSEIFIQDIEYLSRDEYKEIKKIKHKVLSVSRYRREFWKSLNNYKPLAPLIEKQMNEVLIMRK